MLGQAVPTSGENLLIFAEIENRTMLESTEDRLEKTMHKWGEDTLWALRQNMRVQHVWPNLVYPRYDEVNKIREENGEWFSTGQALKSLKFVVKNHSLSNARIEFFFIEYLRYVDIGVGKGRRAEDVPRARKAKYKNRYNAKWVPSSGRTHRPAFMMEFRHLQRRMAWHMQEELGYEGMAYIMEGFKGMIPEEQINQ